MLVLGSNLLRVLYTNIFVVLLLTLNKTLRGQPCRVCDGNVAVFKNPSEKH